MKERCPMRSFMVGLVLGIAVGGTGLGFGLEGDLLPDQGGMVWSSEKVDGGATSADLEGEKHGLYRDQARKWGQQERDLFLKRPCSEGMGF
jgi:hypothetical protein